MDDNLKTKAELIAELEALRSQVTTLKKVTEQLQPEKIFVDYPPNSSTGNPKYEQILIVEDSEVDCNIYKRFLKNNQNYNFNIIAFDSGEEALTWCQQNQPDILLLDYNLPDMDGLEFIGEFRKYWKEDQCPVVIITGLGNTKIAIEFLKQGAQDYLDKSQITEDSLNRTINYLIEKKQLLQEQKWQQQRQQLIAKTALSIRQSLNLELIFQTTVTEIREILQSDRVIIYQFQPDRCGIVVQESTADPALSILGRKMPEEHFPHLWIEPYQQGRTRVMHDIYTDPNISDCHREFLEYLQVRSNLIAPLLFQDKLWGLLIAHHCTASRYWTESEVELIKELANQVSIGIQQATLLEQLQTELLERKQVETSLIESQERFQMAIEAADLGTWRFDLATQTSTVSNRFKEIYGFPITSETLTVDAITQRIHPDDRSQVINNIMATLQTLEPYSAEYQIIRPDGTIRWILSKGKAFCDQEGNLISIKGCVLDITSRKQAEIELMEREETLRLFFNYAPVGIAMLDRNLHYVMASQGWINDYQLESIESILGRSHYDIFPEIPEHWKQIHRQCLTGIIAKSDGDLLIRADGTQQWIRWEIRPWRNSLDEICGITIFSEDITERKQAEIALQNLNQELEKQVKKRTRILTLVNNRLQEELIRREIIDKELQQREELLKSFFDAASSANIGLLILDHQLRFLQVNQALADINSLPIEAHIHHSVPELFPHLSSNLVPILQQVQQTGKPISNIEIGIALPSDPELIRYWLVSYFSIPGITNPYPFVGAIVVEISDRKQIEATLQESHRRWQSLLDNVQLIVVGLDSQGYVEYINPFFLKLTEYTEEEVLGKSWFDHFIPASNRLELSKSFQKIISNNLLNYYKNKIITKSGAERIVSWNNTLLKNREGQPIGTISIGEDITERYELERMKAEFISIVSHELRTPLTSMQAGLSLLHNNIITPSSPEGKITLDIVMTGVNRLVRLVNDILDLERLESGKINLEIQHFDVTILIDTAIAQMQDLANEGGITLERHLQPYEVNADPDRLLQVLINLISNAIKFSPTGSKIEVSVTLEQSHASNEINLTKPILSKQKGDKKAINGDKVLLFTIQDQGRGIPQDNLETIFERFKQVDSSDSREKGGTGLGLAICRSIIQQHGGHIWAESCLGQGSTFYFTIPIDYETNSNY